MNITAQTLTEMERRYRANLINSIGGFKSLVLVGTKSLEGRENLALFSSLFHLGADPALCGIIIRPQEIVENTRGNILNTKVYTINHVHPGIYQQAHQCSAKYAAGVSEFEATGLTPIFKEGIEAPFVAESKISFACKMVEEIPIKHNRTTLVIGQIFWMEIPDACLKEDGFIDIEQAGSITCSGLDSYHTTHRINRLPYAKVKKEGL